MDNAPVGEHFDDVLAGNAAYARTFADRGVPLHSTAELALVTCMDSRIDPLGILGLAPGDAKILRTAGARVTEDVLRSLVLARYLLGVERVIVLAHTDCAMQTREDDVHAALRDRGIDSRSMEFHTFEDPDSTLARDVQRIRSSPYLSDSMPVLGGVYDVRTGAIRVVVQ